MDGGDPAFARFPAVEADTLQTRFIAGYYITVSAKKATWPRGQGPILEKLEGLDDVWSFCFRKPPPGWRLLGRFLDRDVFIGLRFIEKRDLAGRYDEVSAEVIAEWNRLFPDTPPLRGAGFDEYLGGNWRDMDHEEQA